MISLYGLFILLLTAETIHAQGDTNDGDAVDHVSGSNDATSLPLGTTPTTLPTTLQESNTPDQSDASSSADLQPGKECKGGHGYEKYPVHAHSNNHNQDHSHPLFRSEEPSVARCMSSRPPNPLIPYEFMLQKYLSRPGHENPYVPMALDYYILKDAFILVMEYVDENWVDLSKYVDEKGKPDIETARDIVKEVINGMIYLKQYGIVHNDLNAGNVMYNPKTGQVKLLDFEHCYSTHSFAHLVVECEQVTGHRIQSGLVPAIQKSRLRLLGRALDPGVENVYTWLRGGVINGEADLDQRWLDGDCGA
ncbi:hypothetical protein BASA50_000733 [Batrachochytrium salamandrivorans]|uniref:non-specific serine/threonine protein kinase n=1 Tax=Batrachochytrium salamandrivorans TaxID=1357716 RepID=A0ABQ8ETD7_9FUNG|nr:hypothetical protein BASA50_000733 [Batrachochytrium salamandrivorans]